MNASVVSVNTSTGKGTPKQPVAEIAIDLHGVVGDAHAGPWHRQVSLLSRDVIEVFQSQMDREIGNGEFAENITTQGLDLSNVCVMDRLVVGDAELVVTQIGKACHGDACAIFREVGKCVMPKEGIFCRVLRGGTVRPGSPVEHKPRALGITVVTVSDRASRGEYEDRSGPAVVAAVEEFLGGTRWHPCIQNVTVPDDADVLRREIESSVARNDDVVILTGGTGIGPRDVTPEVVTAFCDKLIPGVMEFIRLKHGADKPNALLSRSVAGVKGTTLVYAIPGSVRAAREYMAEILRTMEHAVLMLHDIDVH